MTHSLDAAADFIVIRGFLLGMTTDEVLFHFVVVSGAAILLWLGVNWVDRLRLRRALNAQTPQALLRELCRAHRLSRADRQFVAQIAEESPAGQSCRVFIEPRIIDEYAGAHPAAAEQCRCLAKRLFGEPL
jgi:hypothetical protein